jgi:hypothetical protein
LWQNNNHYIYMQRKCNSKIGLRFHITVVLTYEFYLLFYVLLVQLGEL